MWYKLNTVARLFQALMLIAGLLWCGVCDAQCRVLPQVKAKKQNKKLPPCHQQKQSPVQEDCNDEGCSVSYADAEKSLDTAVDFALTSGPEQFNLIPVAIYDLRTTDFGIVARPHDSVSILRI